MLALESAEDPRLTAPYPFDVLGAQTQGMIGYWLLQALQNALPGRQVASIINQTLVLAARPGLRTTPPSSSARSTPTRRRSGWRRCAAGRCARTAPVTPGAAWSARRSRSASSRPG